MYELSSKQTQLISGGSEIIKVGIYHSTEWERIETLTYPTLIGTYLGSLAGGELGGAIGAGIGLLVGAYSSTRLETNTTYLFLEDSDGNQFEIKG